MKTPKGRTAGIEDRRTTGFEKLVGKAPKKPTPVIGPRGRRPGAVTGVGPSPNPPKMQRSGSTGTVKRTPGPKINAAGLGPVGAHKRKMARKGN